MSNIATQRSRRACHTNADTPSNSRHLSQVDDKMKRLVEQLGALVGQAIADKFEAALKDGAEHIPPDNQR